VLAAYVVPGAAAWAAVGLALGVAAVAIPWLSTAAVVATAVYGCLYGAVEVRGLPWPAAPGRRWQVPQDLLIGASPRRRVLVWGSILGPGFLTRNPYAGFAILPVLVAAAGGVQAAIVVGALVGVAHAAGRGAALLRDSSRPQDEPFVLLLSMLRWRTVDGLALLAVAGSAAVVAGFRLG
jgi:hypothetical protein